MPMTMQQISPDLYQELRVLAKRLMRGERKDHTLSATDLFHEAYARLRPTLSTVPDNIIIIRALFAVTMRRLLIDHARKRSRRSKKLMRVGWNMEDFECLSNQSTEDELAAKLLELDEAIVRLANHYPTHARVVELKFFGGMSVGQCSEHLGICKATTQRYWNFARAWISRELDRIALE